MVSRCVAKEVQRNAKWGCLMWKKRVGEMERKSGRDGKGKLARWEKRVNEVKKENE